MGKRIATAAVTVALAFAGAVPAGAGTTKSNPPWIQAELPTRTVQTPARPRTCGYNRAMRNPRVFERQEARGCFRGDARTPPRTLADAAPSP